MPLTAQKSRIDAFGLRRRRTTHFSTVAELISRRYTLYDVPYKSSVLLVLMSLRLRTYPARNITQCLKSLGTAFSMKKDVGTHTGAANFTPSGTRALRYLQLLVAKVCSRGQPSLDHDSKAISNSSNSSSS